MIIYPEGIRFLCTRCGICCGDTDSHKRRVRVTRNEAARLSRKLSLPVGQFAAEIEVGTPFPYEMKKRADGKCIFLEGEECSIYDDRPIVCKSYPFSLEEIRPDLYVFEPNLEECPGIGEGGELRRDFFERLLGEAFAEFQRPPRCK